MKIVASENKYFSIVGLDNAERSAAKNRIPFSQLNHFSDPVNQEVADSPVKPVKGQRTVEVKSLWANKRQICERFRAAGPQPEFILAAGDDATDEDLFAQVPSSAWTIHVGSERSRARYYLPGPNEMVELISQFGDLVMPEESGRPESVGLFAA